MTVWSRCIKEVWRLARNEDHLDRLTAHDISKTLLTIYKVKIKLFDLLMDDDGQVILGVKLTEGEYQTDFYQGFDHNSKHLRSDMVTFFLVILIGWLIFCEIIRFKYLGMV